VEAVKRDRDEMGHPLIWLMDGRTVVTRFGHVHGQWVEHGAASKAEQRFIDRRDRELGQLSGRAREERRAQYGREARGHLRQPLHHVRLIGDELFEKAYRPDLWDGVRLHDIPGYREVYDFGRGHTFRAEILYQTLDAIRDAGICERSLHALKLDYEGCIKSQSC
jgi:hypothetical protein